jgi:hypothetical protein
MNCACPACGLEMTSAPQPDGSTVQSCACGAQILIPRKSPVESLERRVSSIESSVRALAGNADDWATRLNDAMRRIEKLEGPKVVDG